MQSKSLESPYRKAASRRVKITRSNKNDKFENKVLCLVIGVIGLLSIGLCVQADAIAQCLREMVKISVQQTIYINNQ